MVLQFLPGSLFHSLRVATMERVTEQIFVVSTACLTWAFLVIGRELQLLENDMVVLALFSSLPIDV